MLKEAIQGEQRGRANAVLAVLVTCMFACALFPLAACGQSVSPAAQNGEKSTGNKASNALTVFLERHRQKLMALDLDGDGRISRAEFDADATKKAEARGETASAERASHIDALWSRIDLNKDGFFTSDEIDEAGRRLFARRDKGDAKGDNRS